MIPLSPSMRRAADAAIALLAAAVVILFAVMVALVFVQIVDRFVGFGWFWTEEIVRILLIWSVMFGLPIVLYRHEEILVEILSLSVPATRWRLRLVAALAFVFLAILAWQGWTFTLRNANFTSPSLGISRAWIYLPIPAGAALGCIALLIRAEERAVAWPEVDDAPSETDAAP